MKVVKYSELVKSKKVVPIDEDKGMTEYRAFGVVGEQYAKRVSTPEVIGVMEEVLGNLTTALQERKRTLGLA